MFKIPLIFIQIHEVIVFVIPEVIFKSKSCRYFGYLTPIYSVTSEKIKLIARYEIDVCISAHLKEKCA